MAESGRIIDRFARKVNEALDHHKELILAVYGKKRQSSLEARLAEQFIMSLAVLWEAFVSDLILAYIIEDPKTYLQSVKARINQSLTEKFGAPIAKRVRFLTPRNLNRSQALSMIDPKGTNITSRSAENLSNRANTHLAAKAAMKFSFDSHDREAIDLLLCIRNYLAHRSKMSRGTLKDAIADINSAGRNAPLAGQFATSGSFLRQMAGTDTKAVFIAKRLVEIAEKLR